MLAVSCIVMGLVLASFVPSSASQTVADSRSPTQDDFGGGAPPPPPPPTDMSPPPDLDAFQPPDPTTPPDVDLGGTPPPPPPSETSSCPPDPNTAPDPTAPPSIDNCDPPSVDVDCDDADSRSPTQDDFGGGAPPPPPPPPPPPDLDACQPSDQDVPSETGCADIDYRSPTQEAPPPPPMDSPSPSDLDACQPSDQDALPETASEDQDESTDLGNGSECLIESECLSDSSSGQALQQEPAVPVTGSGIPISDLEALANVEDDPLSGHSTEGVAEDGDLGRQEPSSKYSFSATLVIHDDKVWIVNLFKNGEPPASLKESSPCGLVDSYDPNGSGTNYWAAVDAEACSGRDIESGIESGASTSEAVEVDLTAMSIRMPNRWALLQRAAFQGRTGVTTGPITGVSESTPVEMKVVTPRRSRWASLQRDALFGYR